MPKEQTWVREQGCRWRTGAREMQRLSQKCTICQREFIEQSSCAACFRYEVEGRVDLYVAPQASIAEPVLTLRYGDEECTITYTGLHHLLNCGGWDDRHRDNLYFNEDARLHRWLEKVRQQMGMDASAKLNAARNNPAPHRG